MIRFWSYAFTCSAGICLILGIVSKDHMGWELAIYSLGVAIVFAIWDNTESVRRK